MRDTPLLPPCVVVLGFDASEVVEAGVVHLEAPPGIPGVIEQLLAEYIMCGQQPRLGKRSVARMCSPFGVLASGDCYPKEPGCLFPLGAPGTYGGQPLDCRRVSYVLPRFLR